MDPSRRLIYRLKILRLFKYIVEFRFDPSLLSISVSDPCSLERLRLVKYIVEFRFDPSLLSISVSDPCMNIPRVIIRHIFPDGQACIEFVDLTAKKIALI
jgi:hypothetical protein